MFALLSLIDSAISLSFHPDITETSSQILSMAIPTATTSPDPDMCNGDKNNHEKTVSMLVFASVLTASAVVILALTVVVIILSCKICCNKKCLGCHRKRQGAQKGSNFVMLSISPSASCVDK